jgi:hypothetical protein
MYTVGTLQIKLLKQVQTQVDAMLAKEKAFYGKMFG